VYAVRAGAADNATLTTRSEYELYSGDLDVSVSIPRSLNATGVSLQLVSVPDGRRVTTYPLPTDDGFVGDVSVKCGAVDFAGKFVFQLVERQAGAPGRVIAETAPVDVTWPSSAVRLQLPTSHRALTGRLNLTVDVAGLHCDSAHRGVYYTLQLRYLGLDDTAAAGLHHQTRELVDSRKFASLTSLGAQRMTYACRLIDQAGVYGATTSLRRRAQANAETGRVRRVGSSTRRASTRRPSRRATTPRRSSPRATA